MSYLSDASLVMIPSGVEAGTVFTSKPAGGSADLTFTRSNDTATRVGPNGYIEKVRTNLILQSNSFDTTWTNGNSAETSGQSDPDGGTTAWKITETTTATGATSSLAQSITASAGTFSFYAKAGEITQLLVFFGGAIDGVYFNLSTGAFISYYNTGSVFSSVKIVSVGGGWYRYSITLNTNITSVDFYSAALNNFIHNTVSGNGYFLWRTQYETGDIATDYIATTTAAVSVGPVANVPRINFDPVLPRTGSLLLEPQRTNEALYSEQLNNAAWSKLNTTISANAAEAPDGTTSADLVYPTTTGADRLIEKVIFATTGQTWTSSFFVKASGFSWVLVYSPNLGTCWFNASTGVFGTVAAGVTATVLGQVNGFWRVSFTGTLNSGNAYFYAGPADANNSTTATTSGTNGLLIWGCQLEQGAYPTSYIPTYGAAATRGADTASKTGISSVIGQTEGTLFADFIYDGDFQHRFSIAEAGSNNNWIFMSIPETGTGNGRVYIRTNSVTHLDTSTGLGSGTFVKGQRYKVAFAYKSGDWAIYINGTLKSSGSQTFTAPSPSFDGFYPSGTGPSSGAQVQLSAVDFNQNILFQTRLTNDQLSQITTL